VAVIHGLKLLSFEAGDILVAEGGPGDSLFILASGSVKAFVKNPKGHYVKVNELGEGAFFGEIAVLTGRPRTATITAASRCEVLELDRPALDAITATHPRVREILKQFHEQRAQDTVQAMIRKRE
jgi:CRP-like cAMP-binding protein